MKLWQSYSNWLYRKLGIGALVVSVLVFALFIGLVLPGEAERSRSVTGSGLSPDSSFFYTAQALYDMAESYGEEGRAYYIRARFSFDLIWPLAYAFFLTAALTLLYRGMAPERRWRRLHLLPTAAMGFDLAENMAASLVMYRFPERTPVVAELATGFTMAKWSLIYTSFALIGAGLVLLLVRQLRRLR